MTAVDNFCMVKNECWGANNLKFEITRYVQQNNNVNKRKNKRSSLPGSDTALLELLKNYAKLELEPKNYAKLELEPSLPVNQNQQNYAKLEKEPSIPVKRNQNLKNNRSQKQKQNLHLDFSSTSISQKSVRFADKFGLKLSNVKTITPSPDSPMSLSPPLIPTPTLVPMFPQPGCSPHFLLQVKQSNIQLESASMSGDNCLSGLVWVNNIHFIKKVVVRWTKNNWGRMEQEEAEYVEDDNKEVDRFRFTVHVEGCSIGERVEMCFSYEAGGGQYWDNNYGHNYVFQVINTIGGRNISTN